MLDLFNAKFYQMFQELMPIVLEIFCKIETERTLPNFKRPQSPLYLIHINTPTKPENCGPYEYQYKTSHLNTKKLYTKTKQKRVSTMIKPGFITQKQEQFNDFKLINVIHHVSEWKTKTTSSSH